MEQRPIGDLLDEATERLCAVEVTDTAAVLQAAWQGFCIAGAAGNVLALCADEEEYPPLWENARPVLNTAIGVLRDAPSLPAGLPTDSNPAGGPEDRLGDEAAEAIRRQIMRLVLALNSVLPLAAEHATSEADRRACQQATMLSSELGDCYEGRLRSFLNPWRTHFGPGSVRVRGQGRGGRAGGGTKTRKRKKRKR